MTRREVISRLGVKAIDVATQAQDSSATTNAILLLIAVILAASIEPDRLDEEGDFSVPRPTSNPSGFRPWEIPDGV